MSDDRTSEHTPTVESSAPSSRAWSLLASNGETAEDVSSLKAELEALKAALRNEKQRREAAEAQVMSLKRASTLAQVAVEEEEEAIANRLMKRLSALKQEKEQIARASESDSEWVTNSLTARLDELKKQKQTVIAAAEAENEFIVNRLNKELEALRIEKNELERRVEQLSRSTTPAGGTPGSSPARSFSSGGFSRTGSYRLPAAASAADSTDEKDRIAPMPHSPYSGAQSPYSGGRQ